MDSAFLIPISAIFAARAVGVSRVQKNVVEKSSVSNVSDLFSRCADRYVAQCRFIADTGGADAISSRAARREAVAELAAVFKNGSIS